MVRPLHRRVIWLLCLLCLLVPSTLFAQDAVESDAALAWKTNWYTSELPIPVAPATADAAETTKGEPLPESLAPNSGVSPFTILAWQSVQTNNWDIRAAVESEGNIYRITRDSTSDVNPAVRPGTTEVAYTRIASDGNSDIYRVQATGSDPSPLITSSASDNYPTYSGDGQWLYFASTRHGNWELYRANADGGDISRITDNPLPDAMPSVSRDGTMITWVRQVNEVQGVLMRANADGSNPVALTNPIAFLQHPRFSPDGTRIGFDGDLNGNNWNDVAYFNLGTNTITTNSNASGYTNIDYWFSGWSPIDPNEIIYTRVVYVVIQGNLYLQETRVYNEIIGQQGPRPMFNDARGMNGAWERTEVVVPTVSMAPLPEYSKVTDTKVLLTGVDAGAAPITFYEVQIKTDGDWRFYANSITPNVTIIQPSGTEFEVRARAIDGAGNRSAFSEVRSTQTYSGELTLTATDVLGNEQPNTTFALSPAPLTVDTISPGKRFIRHTISGTATVRPTAPHFGQLPTASIDALMDTEFTTYFPGTDDVITNGAFIDELEGWETGGDVAPMVLAGGHGDVNGVSFCPMGNCWSREENPETNSSQYGLTIDAVGTLHVIYGDCCNNEIYYQSYSQVTGWSDASPAFVPVNSASVKSLKLYMAVNGTLHVTYNDNNRLRYAQRTPNGVWSTPEIIYSHYGSGDHPYDAVWDTNGVLHLIFFKVVATNPAVFEYYYRQRLPNGTWTPEEVLARHGIGPGGSSVIAPILLTMPNGVVYAWMSGAGLYGRFPEQGWVPVFYNPDPNDAIYNGSAIAEWLVAPDGIIHSIVYRFDSNNSPIQFRYGQFSPTTNQWNEWSELPTPRYVSAQESATMALHPDGSLWVILPSENEPLFFKRSQNGSWSQRIPWRDGRYLLPQTKLQFTAAGEMQITGFNGITLLNNAETEQSSLLAQQVDLSDMTRPTLGFMYRFEHAWQATDASLTISVTNGVTATELFRTTATPEQQDWTLGSADLSLYTGETVTVTFAYHQPEGQQWMGLMVDDVSLTSYSAPLLLSATPAVIESNWVGEVITVTGQNFIAPLTVTINNLPITATRIDDETFTFVIPAGAKAGVQQISVTNGSGFTAKQGILRLGQGLFLPVVEK